MPKTSLVWEVETGGATVPVGLPELWGSDPQCNPFTAPSFLQTMHRTAGGGGTPVWALGRAADGVLAAAWPLRLDGQRRLRFLADSRSDQNGCLARPAVAAAELGTGLAVAMRDSGARGLTLLNVPPWGCTLDAVEEAMREAGWRWRTFPAWSCPVLRPTPDGDPAGALRAAIERHRRVRGYANALRREPGYELEVLEDQEGLDEWSREFADVHERRWRDSPTPSAYGAPAARALLREMLGSWSADGVLVRFAIRLAAGRVVLVAALRAGRRLVYYLVARSPEAERLRAGHVMIRLIGLWMCDRGYDTLDFGAGDEEYKSRYANADDRLWRVFAASHILSPTFARGVVEQRIRASPTLLRAWNEWANRRQHAATP